MAPPGFRRLTLADLTDDDLETLVRHGEDLLVERKREPPTPPRFGAAIGSLANTLGGWVLLGVDDRGDVHGWEKPNSKTDLQSYLGSLLKKEVDPLPPFVADMHKLDGKSIGVIRVFESADAPHIVRGTGAVYVRSSKGKEPVDDHQTLLALARRGEEADRNARHRLISTPVPSAVLNAPDSPGYTEHTPREVRFIVRAAPLTVTPALAEWPLTPGAADWCQARVDRLLDRMPPWGVTGPYLEPFGRTIVARITQETGPESADHVEAVADSNGVFGLQKRNGVTRGDRPTVLVDAMLAHDIEPLAVALIDMLTTAEAYGRAIVDLWVIVGPKGQYGGGFTNRDGRPLHASRELTVPAEREEVKQLALAWHRELQRAVGIAKYERDE